MAHRIEVTAKHPDQDTRATIKTNQLKSLGYNVTNTKLVDVYTIDLDITATQLDEVAKMLSNSVVHSYTTDRAAVTDGFDWAIETGFLPGVTDNVATTTKEAIADLLGITMPKGAAGVHTSQLLCISGELSPDQVKTIGESLANPLIQRIHTKAFAQYQQDHGMDVIVPQVKLAPNPQVDVVDILQMNDDELTATGKQGIKDADGSRRGPLALDLTYMKTIQAYFKKLGRNPNDIELESIAQTWSEHCKHTIFADPLDEIEAGLYKTYIKAATEAIRKQKGNEDFCVSVFTDNSGAIAFDEQYLVTDKAETHNSPSALDPFGGAITGIVGVNRDALGFGLGAKPIMNRYGYCLADPRDTTPLYRGADKTQPMLSPRRIMEGVVAGTNAGGNQSGIPGPQGFVCFDDRYKGKPLVFVGTVGLIPREIAGRPSHIKAAQPNDYIVVVGGRVGQDGIHGATFSSEAMTSGSPATAVQIGDPITQKKALDAILTEARDVALYTSITDNGAGGISCSVAEMAKESNGCVVKLDDVPLKYPGLEPWKIWISESQERMTLAVPQDKWLKFKEVMDNRGVEATVIGTFTDSGRCVVEYGGKTIMDIDMEFLHDGLPARPMKTTYTKPQHTEPNLPEQTDYTQSLQQIMGRLNIASWEFISMQYDHEVQGGSVIKPLQGRGRVNGDATVQRPVLSTRKGIVTSQGINPTYSDIDTYHMAACAIDTAVRNAVAVGGNVDYMALMDNFCWCSSTEPERLGQLKAAVKACYDYALAYGTPFISGKDSMFNDFKGYDANNQPVKISIPPTLLVSSLGVIDDVTKTVSLDAKMPGDLVYVLGETNAELGGSEYYAMQGAVGQAVPQVDAQKNLALYRAYYQAVQQGLVASAQSVHRGGLAVALAKTALSGRLGMKLYLDTLAGNAKRLDQKLYSESQGRIVVTVAPNNQKQFEQLMPKTAFTEIGAVQADDTFTIEYADITMINASLDTLHQSYKATLKNY